ncbi:MAG: hypothetical protein C0616_04105 [Desulfuromonas sp.]|nr:MAG: hypothetical protein C0616_04105 [Desulfuromonas sp.]
MKRTIYLTITTLVATSLLLPAIGLAEMNRGERRGMQADRSGDRQAFRQERLGDRRELRDASRDQLREHREERLLDGEDFVMERRQDRQHLRVDVTE